MFDIKLMEILEQYNGKQLLHIPGIYEILSEYFNNDVLEKIEDEKNILMFGE